MSQVATVTARTEDQQIVYYFELCRYKGATLTDSQGRPFRVTDVLWNESLYCGPKVQLIGEVSRREDYGQTTWLELDAATGEVPVEYKAPEHADWTVAYRKPRANRFRRIPLQLTWRQAQVLATLVFNALGGEYEVYTVSTAEAEATDRVAQEDKGNVLSHTGRRVRLVDTGALPEGVQVPSLDDERVVHYFD